MNKFILTALLLVAIITPVTFFELYKIKIVPVTSSASIDNNPQYDDACSPQFYIHNLYNVTIRIQQACQEQINLKLDKLISLEEQESKP